MRESVTGGGQMTTQSVTGTVRHCYTVASASHRTPSSDGHWRMLLRTRREQRTDAAPCVFPPPGAALSSSVHCITSVASVQLGRDWDGMCCWPVKIGIYLGRAAFQATSDACPACPLPRVAAIPPQKAPPRLEFPHLVQGLRIRHGAIVHNHRPQARARGLAVSIGYYHKSG